MNQISGAPTTKDIELAECLAKLRGANNDNNNNNNNFPPFLSPPPPPPPLPPTPPPSSPDGGDGESDDDNDDDDDDDDDDSNRNFMLTQRFLFDQPQRTAIAVGTNNAAKSAPLQEQKVRFSENLSKVLPKANDIFELDHHPKITDKEEMFQMYKVLLRN